MNSLRFKNCGGTKEQQTLLFNKGLNVLIGGNSLKKSTILDVLEICLSKDKWERLSSDFIVDMRERAYVICTFDLENSRSQQKDNSGANQMRDSPNQRISHMLVWIYDPSAKQGEAGTVYGILGDNQDGAIELQVSGSKAKIVTPDIKKIVWKLANDRTKDVDQHIEQLVKIIPDAKCETMGEQLWDRICESTHFAREVSIMGRNGFFQELLETAELERNTNETVSLVRKGHISTLCLKDSDTSQMQCDQFLFQPEQLQNMIVIVVTHNPAFLLPSTLRQTYFCREDGPKGVTFISGAPLSEMKSMTHRDLRLLTDGKFCSLFFAKTVMFMEGEADLAFMKCLKKKILTNNGTIGRLVNDTNMMQLLRTFMSEVHLMHMDGETNRKRLKTACDKLLIPCLFLIDKDTVVDKVSKTLRELASTPKQQKSIADDTDMVKLDYELKQLKYPEQWSKIKTKLEEVAGIMVWSDGDIEDMIIGLCIPNKDLVEEKLETTKEVTERESESIDENRKRNITTKKEKSTETKLKTITEETKTYMSMPPENQRIEVVEFVDLNMEENAGKTKFTKTEVKRRRWYKKDVFLKQMGEYIKIPFTRWKMSKKPKFKIYNGVGAEEHIDKSMDLLLKRSLDSPENEIKRLLMFLLTRAKKWQDE